MRWVLCFPFLSLFFRPSFLSFPPFHKLAHWPDYFRPHPSFCPWHRSITRSFACWTVSKNCRFADVSVSFFSVTLSYGYRWVNNRRFGLVRLFHHSHFLLVSLAVFVLPLCGPGLGQDFQGDVICKLLFLWLFYGVLDSPQCFIFHFFPLDLFTHSAFVFHLFHLGPVMIASSCELEGLNVIVWSCGLPRTLNMYVSRVEVYYTPHKIEITHWISVRWIASICSRGGHYGCVVDVDPIGDTAFHEGTPTNPSTVGDVAIISPRTFLVKLWFDNIEIRIVCF